jgi:hypothetical protein
MIDCLMLWAATKIAIAAIIQSWKDEPETLPYLKDLTQHDADWDVGDTIAKTVAQKRQNNPDTLPWLKDDWDFRDSLVKAIAQYWKNDPETLHWFKDLIRRDHDEYVKRDIATQILRDWKDNPQIEPILPFVKYRNRKYVRCTAVEVIAKCWKNDPDILPWFKNLAQHSKNSLQHGIFEVLAREWKNDPDTLPILNHIVLHDDDWNTRLCVLSIIRQFYENDSDFLSIFKNCARYDNQWVVRHIALEALAERRKYRTNIFDFLYCLVLDDPFQRQNPNEYNPRLTALRAIIKNYRDRPEVLDLLLDRSKNDPDEQVRKFAEKELLIWRSRLTN